MKKLLVLLLIAPMIGNSQERDITDLNINGLNFIGEDYLVTYWHTTEADHITIPDNEYWFIFLEEATIKAKLKGWENYGFMFYFASTSIGNEVYYHSPQTNLVGGGSKFYFDEDGNGTLTDENCSTCLVRVFKYETTKFQNQNSLSYNEPETIKNNSNKPVLFPNPTSSLLALNSDKQYDIEVYDMAGNKLMALTGNSINMEHLSTATYIVKATDKSNNEELTYKVVKN
ncbi:T9SS type A sorting domain-containing protein [Flavobacteriaceae bacterium]|nr:T9SS type A sorting domain-containing protein [Flavobacteriaceae bacterium]